MKAAGIIKIMVIVSVVLLLSSGLMVDIHGKDIKRGHRERGGSFEGLVFNNRRIILMINKDGSATIKSAKDGKVLIEKMQPIVEIKERGKWVDVKFNHIKIRERDHGKWHTVKIKMEHRGKIRVKVMLKYFEKRKFKRYKPLYPSFRIWFSKKVQYRVEWVYKGVNLQDITIIDNGTGYLQAPYRSGHEAHIIYNGSANINASFREDQDILKGYAGKDLQMGLNWENSKDVYDVLEVRSDSGHTNIVIMPSKSSTSNGKEYLTYRAPIPDSGTGEGKDTDGDGLYDVTEESGWDITWYDSQGHKHTEHVTSDPNSTDTDGDGLSDYEEYKLGTNPESADTDGDGLSDYEEVKELKTSPTRADTDGDGLPDGNEYYTRVYEYAYREYISGSKTIYLKYKEDKYSLGVKDARILVGVRGDGTSIHVKVYCSGHKLIDKSTNGYYYGSAELNSYVSKSERTAKIEISGRGWLEEVKVVIVEKSDPKKADTDGDGLSDGYEVLGKSGYVTSPLSRDTDGDGISDYWEIKGWSWNYGEKTKYRNNGGFHTNPVSKDTDGDGYADGIDADPLHNLVLKMTLDKYVWNDHPDYTKFAGFYAKWTLNGESKSIKYYTEHKDYTQDLHGYGYWFDVPDDVHTKLEFKAAAFYNDLGDKKLTEGDVSSYVEKGLVKHINKDNDNKYYFHTTFKLESVGRVHTVAIYNSSVWGGNRYLYSGKYYVLYVESATSWSSNKGNIIKNGLNVVLVPAAIFVNSQLYQKIKSNDISYLQGTKPSDARLGAIDKKSMPVHIVGMFFFKSDGTKMKNMISLLCHNLSNEQFAHYAAITPEQVNIPSDVLEAIPYEGIQNSKTGGAPENLWQQLSGAIGGAISSVADFIYHGLVALGNFIEHAAEVVTQFAMKLWSTGVSVVKKAVEVVKKVVDAVVEWIKEMMAKAIDGFVNLINGLSNNAGTKLGNAAKEMAMDINNNQGEVDTEAVTVDVMKILEVIDGLMTGVLIGISAFAVAELLWYAATEGIGAVVSEIIAGMLKNVVLSLLLTGVAIETMNKVAEKTEHGIDNSVVKGLLNMFSLSSEFAGLIWDIYKLVVEKAENGIYRFYVGLAIAIIGFILSTVGTTLSMSGVILKDYDFLTIAVALGGLSIMYSDRKGDMAGRFLPLTSLLEWSVGWIGVISGFIKLAADAGSHFQG